MSIFKATFSGIGTGAGVAWPLFGLIFSLIGGPIGSCISLALGLFSTFLFLSISALICYFSYKDMENKQAQFFRTYYRHQKKLLKKIECYIQSLFATPPEEILPRSLRPRQGEKILIGRMNHSAYEVITQCLSPGHGEAIEIIEKDLDDAAILDPTSPLSKILHIIHECYQQERSLDIHEMMGLISEIEGPKLQPTLSQCAIKAFFAFAGTFGSIAGCCAGLSGLFTGLGLFTSFATFPVLGWGIIAAATICGICMAIEAVNGAKQEYKSQKLDRLIQKMRHQLDKIIVIRQVDSVLHCTFATLTDQLEEENLFKLMNKSMLNLFQKKKSPMAEHMSISFKPSKLR